MTIFSVAASAVCSRMICCCFLCLWIFSPRCHLKWPLLFPLSPCTSPFFMLEPFASVLFFLASLSLYLCFYLFYFILFFYGEPVKESWWSWLWPLVWQSKMTLPISLTCRKQRRQHHRHQPIRNRPLRRGTRQCTRALVLCVCACVWERKLAANERMWRICYWRKMRGDFRI